MKVFRHATWLAIVAGVVLAVPGRAFAAAEIHRLNLVLSSNPTRLVAEDLNDFIDAYNTERLEPQDKAPLENITFSWLHEAELRYFVRPNITVGAGVGQLSTTSSREYLPRLGQRIVVTTEVLAVPLHVGATYYLKPYNQGDFQARAYVGGGLVSMTQSKVVFFQQEFNTDSATTLNPKDPVTGKKVPGSKRYEGRGDGPGYYLEVGGHMFFASRFSVMLGGYYRSAKIRDLRISEDIIKQSGVTVGEQPIYGADTLDLDVGGLGLRMGVAIGF